MSPIEKRKETLRLATAIEREAQKSVDKGLQISQIDEVFGEFKPEIIRMTKTPEAAPKTERV